VTGIPVLNPFLFGRTFLSHHLLLCLHFLHKLIIQWHHFDHLLWLYKLIRLAYLLPNWTPKVTGIPVLNPFLFGRTFLPHHLLLCLHFLHKLIIQWHHFTEKSFILKVYNKDPFGTVPLHEIQLSFTDGLPNTLTSITRLKKVKFTSTSLFSWSSKRGDSQTDILNFIIKSKEKYPPLPPLTQKMLWFYSLLRPKATSSPGHLSPHPSRPRELSAGGPHICGLSNDHDLVRWEWPGLMLPQVVGFFTNALLQWRHDNVVLLTVTKRAVAGNDDTKMHCFGGGMRTPLLLSVTLRAVATVGFVTPTGTLMERDRVPLPFRLAPWSRASTNSWLWALIMPRVYKRRRGAGGTLDEVHHDLIPLPHFSRLIT
jgi:hypothetical protein